MKSEMDTDQNIREKVIDSVKKLESGLNTFESKLSNAIHQMTNCPLNLNEFVFIEFPEIQEYQELEGYEDHSIIPGDFNQKLGITSGGAFIEKSWYLSHSK